MHRAWSTYLDPQQQQALLNQQQTLGAPAVPAPGPGQSVRVCEIIWKCLTLVYEIPFLNITRRLVDGLRIVSLFLYIHPHTSRRASPPRRPRPAPELTNPPQQLKASIVHCLSSRPVDLLSSSLHPPSRLRHEHPSRGPQRALRSVPPQLPALPYA